MNTKRLAYWLIGIKVLLWISVVGFGITLVNATSLIFTTNNMITEVTVNKPLAINAGIGKLTQNFGIYTFQSKNILDRLLFTHVYGYHDLIQSVFSFVSCCLLLITVNGINPQSPFTIKVARQIKLIGTVFLIYGIINIGVHYYMYHRVMQMVSEISVRYTTFPADLAYIKAGIFTLIISFVYRIGVAYQEENLLTV
jgi:hypothetical protein